METVKYLLKKTLNFFGIVGIEKYIDWMHQSVLWLVLYICLQQVNQYFKWNH